MQFFGHTLYTVDCKMYSTHRELTFLCYLRFQYFFRYFPHVDYLAHGDVSECLVVSNETSRSRYITRHVGR